MRNLSRFGLLALSTLVGGALFGCGGTRPESASPPPPDAAVRDVRLDGAALDLVTNSGAFPDLQYLVNAADEAATRRCMRAAGLTWSGYVYRPPAGTDEERTLDLADRRRRGYGLSDADPGGSAGEGAFRDSAGSSSAADDARTGRALFGPTHKVAELRLPGGVVVGYPVQGCVAQAHADVFGDVTTWARVTNLPPEVNLALSRTARADPRHQDALGAWSRCMAEQGHPYPTPDDIRKDLGRRYATDREPPASRRAAEIALALQDAACNRKVRLTVTELAVRREAAQRLDARQRAELTELTARFHEAVARARSLS